MPSTKNGFCLYKAEKWHGGYVQINSMINTTTGNTGGHGK